MINARRGNNLINFMFVLRFLHTPDYWNRFMRQTSLPCVAGSLHHYFAWWWHLLFRWKHCRRRLFSLRVFEEPKPDCKICLTAASKHLWSSCSQTQTRHIILHNIVDEPWMYLTYGEHKVCVSISCKVKSSTHKAYPCRFRHGVNPSFSGNGMWAW